MTTRKLTSNAIAKSATTYVGRTGEIFYDTATATLRLSNGSTAGGVAFSGGAAIWPVTNTSGASGPTNIAIGLYAGDTSQGFGAVAIGTQAGQSTQDLYAVSIGYAAGNDHQKFGAVAIGSEAGQHTQGTSAVAIGRLAGNTNQADNTIILNASSSAVNGVSAQTNSFYVAPIRTDATPSNVLYYNTTTKEVTYGAGAIANIINLPTYISGTLDYSSYTLGGAMAVGSNSHTYDGVQAIATSGVGDIGGVLFTIVRGGSSYQSIMTSAIGIGQGQIGSGFAVGDTLTFAGASLGGTTPTNNLTVTINTVHNQYPTGAGLGYGTLIYDYTTNHIMSFDPADYSWMQIDRQTVARTPSSTLNIAGTTTTGTVNIASNMTTGGLVNIGGNGGVSIGNLSVSALTVLNPLPYIWLSLYQYYSGSLLTSSFGTITGTAVGATRVVTGVTQSSTSGRGTGAQFQVTVVNNGQSGGGLVISYTVVSIDYNGGNQQYGSGYAVGDTVTIAGASLGGTTPTNNMTFTVGNAVKNNYPAGLEGGMIYDYTSKHFMGYNGSTWIQLDNPLTPSGTKASNAYGIAGQTSYDANYSYTCIATNTWRRVALGSTY